MNTTTLSSKKSALGKPALLALADGSLFQGIAFGCDGESVGEVVFNTAMTGYQEVLTDASYAKQIVTLTYPHIGNVGCNKGDFESQRSWLSGLVIRDLSSCSSNWRAEMSLQDFLMQQGILGIAEIDTRRLTRLLREKGAQNGCITTQVDDPERAIKIAQAFPGLEGMDLAKEVSCKQSYLWEEGSLAGFVQQDITEENKAAKNSTESLHIVAYDYGVKHTILRLLVDRGCKVTVVPAQTPAEDVLKLNPDGIFLSNGPGDPAACDYAIAAVRKFLTTDIPIFGICLGFQILGLAWGAKSLKMKFGHHGANHPVSKITDEKTTVLISSQNHGFNIDEATLPAEVQVTHRSLFDGSLQGIRHRFKPVFGFQGHPEAGPGPQDVQYLFDQFVNDCRKRLLSQ